MNTEFFHSDAGLTFSPEMVIQNGEYETFGQFTETNNIIKIVAHLRRDNKAGDIVKKMEDNGIKAPFMILHQFKECNWAALDKKPDIEVINELDVKFNFEYVECGHKGANKRCPFSIDGDPKPYCIYKRKTDVPVN